MLVTGLVGRFGVAALAGYGIGVRLEFMLVPLAFGIGSGLTTLVGVAAGAGDWKRAVRVAWTGGLTSPAPHRRLRLDRGAAARGLVAAVHQRSPGDRRHRRLHHPRGAVLLPVRPRHDAVSFASQGAGRMTAPFVAGVARLIVATVGGWFAVEILGWRPGRACSSPIAVGMIAFGGLIAGPLLVRPWRTASASLTVLSLPPQREQDDAARPSTIATWNRNPADEEAMGAAHAPIWRRMIDVSVPHDLRDSTVLDYGCNQGGFLRMLYDRHPFKSGRRHRHRPRIGRPRRAAEGPPADRVQGGRQRRRAGPHLRLRLQPRGALPAARPRCSTRATSRRRCGRAAPMSPPWAATRTARCGRAGAS